MKLLGRAFLSEPSTELRAWGWSGAVVLGKGRQRQGWARTCKGGQSWSGVGEDRQEWAEMNEDR